MNLKLITDLTINDESIKFKEEIREEFYSTWLENYQAEHKKHTSLHIHTEKTKKRQFQVLVKMQNNWKRDINSVVS